jgi:hypothetical protein
MNGLLGVKRIVECTRISDLRNSGIFFYKVGAPRVKIRRRGDTEAVDASGLE